MSGIKAQRVVVAAALVAGIFSVVPAPVRAAFPGDNGLIAYQRATATPTAPDGIMTMNPDGTGQSLLIDTGLGGETAPEWSADATKIVFEQRGDIFVANANGTGVRNLTNSSLQDVAPTWSPDGTRIAYASTNASNDSNLFVMDSDGTNNAQLTPNPRWDGFPSWSPDGTRIAYTSDEGVGLNFGIFTIASGGGTPSFVTDTTVVNAHHDWSPDSTRIAFHNRNEVWLVNPDGTNLTQLTTNDRAFFGIAFSPDGTKIAFRTDRTGNAEIFVMGVDGSNPVNVTNTPTVDERFPDWAPSPGPVPGCTPGPETTCGTEGNDNLLVTVAADATNVVVQTGSGADMITLEIEDPTNPATVLIDSGDDADIVTLPTSPGQVAVEVLSGDGNDVIRATAPSSALARRLAQGAGAGYKLRSGLGKDKIVAGTSIDYIDGGGGPDDVNGAGGADKVGGGGGNDKVEGGAGSDDLLGGGGADVLHGSSGANNFAGGPGTDTCLSDERRDSFTGCERIRRNHRRNHQQA